MYTAMKVFSATKFQEREQLGETVTRWLAENRGIEVVDTVIKQSSDDAFHCLSIILMYVDAATARKAAA